MKDKQPYKLQLIGNYEWDEVVSSLQKMIRRGQEYEAAYWTYILHQSGFGQYLFRRLSIIACEDVGNAKAIAAVIIACLQANWLILHKHNKQPTLDKFLLPLQAVLFLCRARKTRENDSLANLIEENFKANKRLEIDPVSLDSHTAQGRKKYGRFGNLKDGKEKLRLDHWFKINAFIKNLAYEDKWEKELKKIWYGKAKNQSKTNKDEQLSLSNNPAQ